MVATAACTWPGWRGRAALKCWTACWTGSACRAAGTVGRSDRSTVTIVRPAGLSASRAATGAVDRGAGLAVVTSVSAPTVTWEGFSHVVPSPGTSVPNYMVRPVSARSSKRMRWT